MKRLMELWCIAEVVLLILTLDAALKPPMSPDDAYSAYERNRIQQDVDRYKQHHHFLGISPPTNMPNF